MRSVPKQEKCLAPRNILFVAAQSFDIAALISGPLGDFQVTRSRSSAETLALIISSQFSHVIVDLTSKDPALTLLVPLLAGSEHEFELYIVTTVEEISQYLRVRGVDRVFASNRAEKQIRAALDRSYRLAPAPPKPLPQRSEVDQIADNRGAGTEDNLIFQSSQLVRLRARFIGIVSSLYKNLAFVLLASLFLAFCFYGLLIGYFLLSSNWGAPVTLSRGNEFVSKTEQQLNDMRVNLNLVAQRASEAELEAQQARRTRGDADVMVGYMVATVDGELQARSARRSTLSDNLARVENIKAAYEKQLSASGMKREIAALYEKRLIDKKSMQSATLGLLEAGQRLSDLEAQAALLRDEAETLTQSIAMLQSLKERLKGGGQIKTSVAAPADLMLLMKQAVEARYALDQSEAQLSSTEKRLKILSDSRFLLQQRITEVEASPLGRAILQRVDVIFVPYGNERRFTESTPLYSCALTFIVCHVAGQVGRRLPGEANAVHPFFGKPVRGGFVEAILSDPSAASRDIIHAGGPPFVFF